MPVADVREGRGTEWLRAATTASSDLRTVSQRPSHRGVPTTMLVAGRISKNGTLRPYGLCHTEKSKRRIPLDWAIRRLKISLG